MISSPNHSVNSWLVCPEPLTPLYLFTNSGFVIITLLLYTIIIAYYAFKLYKKNISIKYFLKKIIVVGVLLLLLLLVIYWIFIFYYMMH